MEIIINNTKFQYDIGCRILKLKYDECPMSELKDIWDSIEPLSFKEIAKLSNLEQRRIGILCLGLDRLVKEINPTLVSKKTIKKTTTWIDGDGKLITKKFNDTYELYMVDGDYLNEGLESWRKAENSYYLKLKDTSTEREYLMWVDAKSVYRTNKGVNDFDFAITKINAIQCIAWTIQTNVPKGSIEKIVRQGDCVMIKPTKGYLPLDNPRHLTETEYRKLIVAES